MRIIKVTQGKRIKIEMGGQQCDATSLINAEEIISDAIQRYLHHEIKKALINNQSESVELLVAAFPSDRKLSQP